MKVRLLLALIALVTSLRAEPDLAAIGRERQELDRQTERASQQIDQDQEQALVPVHAKVRELKMAADRAFQTASLAVGAALLAGKGEVDTAAVEKARFEQLEVENLEANQLLPEAMDAFEERRAEAARAQSIAVAKIEAKMFAGQPGGDKAANLTIRRAELSAQWNEKIGRLDKELELAVRKIQREHTTRVNRAEARIAALGMKAGAVVNARVREKAAKGEAPTPADLTPSPDPALASAEAARDEARNALQTAIEQKQADFNPRRTALENQRDEELAKLEG